MKRLLVLAIAITAPIAFGATADAGNFSFSYGNGSCYSNSNYGNIHRGYSNNSYSNYGNYNRGYSNYGSYGNYGNSNRGTYHNTSHYDYHAPSLQRHGNHYDYVPGHYDYHQTGHFHR